jgi:hypothetical protein
LWKYNLYDSDSDTKTQSAAPSQDQPDLERQRKFDLLLQYSPSVRDAYAEIAHLPEEFKQRFRAAVLEPGGHHEAKAVGNRLLDEHRKRIRPFDSAEANDFLVKARNLGPAAEKEFMEVMELLGSSASPTEIFEKIYDKYGIKAILGDEEQMLAFLKEQISSSVSRKEDSFRQSIELRPADT